MRKFVTTYTGKHRLRLGDLGFIDAKINEVANGLASAFQFYIISGCVVTQGATTLQISAGYVVLFGELCYCPGGDTGLPNADFGVPNIWYWSISEQVAAPSPVTYQDGLVHDVHFTRIAVLNSIASIINYANTPRYWQAVKGAWVDITALDTNWGTGGTEQFRIRIDAMGRVSLKGAVTYNAAWSAGSQDITTLAALYRPAQTERFPIVVADVYYGTLMIEPTGVVSAIIESAMPSGQMLYFSGVNYFID